MKKIWTDIPQIRTARSSAIDRPCSAKPSTNMSAMQKTNIKPIRPFGRLLPLLGLALAILLAAAGCKTGQNPAPAGTMAPRADAKGVIAQADAIIAAQTQIMEQDNQNAHAYYLRGMAYADKGLYDKAKEDFEQALTMNPRHWAALLNRGVIEGIRGFHDAALKDLDMAIMINDARAEAFFNRGLILGQIGQYRRALEDMSQAIVLNPRYAKAYTYRGRLWMFNNEFAQALKDFDKSLELDPGNAPALFHRGLASEALGQEAQAIESLASVIRAEPSNARAYYHRGVLLDKTGNLNDALKDLNQAIRLDPNYSRAFYARGAVNARLSNYTAAKTDYSDALKILHLARHLSDSLLQKFLETNPWVPDALYQRALAYRVTAEHDKAMADIITAIELAPDQASYLELKALLEQDVENARSSSRR